MSRLSGLTDDDDPAGDEANVAVVVVRVGGALPRGAPWCLPEPQHHRPAPTHRVRRRRLLQGPHLTAEAAEGNQGRWCTHT